MWCAVSDLLWHVHDAVVGVVAHAVPVAFDATHLAGLAAEAASAACPDLTDAAGDYRKMIAEMSARSIVRVASQCGW